MTTAHRLHYAPDNASLCVRLMLEELGVAYETVLVDRSVKEQQSETYLKLNPNGLIPVLETPDGVMFETAAILLWLADSHNAMAPAVDSPERADFLKWLLWLANTLHPALRMLFYPEKFSPAHEPLREMTKSRIADLLTILVNGPDLTKTSALSCYAAPMLRWLALYPQDHTEWFDLTRWPRLHDFCLGFEARPSAIRAADAEGLGETPFSSPSYPTPPEGSAI